MKVGILSMQKVMNYGSFLQGFALKKTIEGLGHHCEFIDIEQGKIYPEYKRTFLFFIKKIFHHFIKWDFFYRVKYAMEFRNRFKNEFYEMLEANKHSIKHFDTVVVGSDEVFNFAQNVPWGYTPQLYGMIINTNKSISYAGSFGHTTMNDILYHQLKDEIATHMNKFSAISVRDNNSYNIVKELTKKEPVLHVDPVLMFDYTPYIQPVNLKNYIIIYTYPNRINNRKEINAIKSFANKYNKRIISIGFYFSWCDETVIPTPFEVLGYIQGADYVVTDTFHGSVMSIKLNKKFATIVRNTNRQKLTSLLSQFNLENRIVDNIESLEEKLLPNCDYISINQKIERECIRSLQYLQNNL